MKLLLLAKRRWATLASQATKNPKVLSLSTQRLRSERDLQKLRRIRMKTNRWSWSTDSSCQQAPLRSNMPPKLDLRPAGIDSLWSMSFVTRLSQKNLLTSIFQNLKVLSRLQTLTVRKRQLNHQKTLSQKVSRKRTCLMMTKMKTSSQMKKKRSKTKTMIQS